MAHPSSDERSTTARADQAVLDLRQDGKSFAAIALALKLGNTRAAHTAFLRALSSSGDELENLRAQELVRLTTLEKSVKSNAKLAAFDKSKKLDVITHLRKQLNEL